MFKKLLFLTVATASTLVIMSKESTMVVLDQFAINNTTETVWLDQGDIITRNGRVIYESVNGGEVTLVLNGNYKVLTQK